jgi:hypothetical protein
MIRNKETLT